MYMNGKVFGYWNPTLIRNESPWSYSYLQCFINTLGSQVSSMVLSLPFTSDGPGSSLALPTGGLGFSFLHEPYSMSFTQNSNANMVALKTGKVPITSVSFTPPPKCIEERALNSFPRLDSSWRSVWWLRSQQSYSAKATVLTLVHPAGTVGPACERWPLSVQTKANTKEGCY